MQKTDQQNTFFKIKHLKGLFEENECKVKQLKDKELFTDETFKIFNKFPECTQEIVWRRPHEIVQEPILGKDRINVDDPIQGNIGNCWFISSLAALALQPELYNQIFREKIILDKSNKKYKGYATIWFWKYNEWIPVIIDDRLPTTKDKKLLFGSCSNSNAFWVPLLEKAYAKLLGSYENLIGGLSKRALTDLTGGYYIYCRPTISVNGSEMLTLSRQHEIEDEIKNLNDNYIGTIVCSKSRILRVGRHAFTLLRIKTVDTGQDKHRIYTIRNPHGKPIESYETTLNNTELKKHLENEDINSKHTMIDSNKLSDVFDGLTLMYFIKKCEKSKIKTFKFIESWSLENEKLNVDTFVKFPHYLLKVRQDTTVLFNLFQDEIEVKKPHDISIYIQIIFESASINTYEKGIAMYSQNFDKSTLAFAEEREEDFYSMFKKVII